MNSTALWPKLVKFSIAVLVLLVVLTIAARLMYPFRYQDEAKVWAVEHRLDLYLVAAVIRAESSFRPGVVSRSGAIGLMQVTPATGEWIAGELGVMGFATDDLLDPNLNLRFGTWYLRHLYDRYGDLDSALLAYNAGPSNLERWRTGDGSVFPETEAYRVRVTRGRTAYRVLYATPVLGWIMRALPLWR